MSGIKSLFDDMTLVVVRVDASAGESSGGIALPAAARVVALRSPVGQDARRKVSIAAGLPYYVWKIVASIRDADVVHTPVPGDIPLLGMLLSLIMRKRTIVRYGGSWPENAQTTFMNRFTKLCMRRFAGGRNVMFATGSGSNSPAAGIHWLFSTAVSKAELRALHPVLDRGLSTPPKLIYVGRFSPEKGVATLLRALHLLARSGFQPLPVLTLAGEGVQRAELEALARELGVTDRVTFAGQLGRERLSVELMRADLCVQPSLTEGFSKAWIDAMAHGLPVVSSDVGAARAVIGSDGERGWIVRAGDVEALAATLREVLSGTVFWEALRSRCRAYAESRTLEAWAEQIGKQCADQWNWTLEAGELRP
jgi:glycosyltransferase involved in cell wall biosynthesis